MARSEYVSTVKSILYGAGMGEKPSMIQANTTASETIASGKVTFNLATGEGSKIRAGDVLSVRADALADAHALYVLSVSTDAVTAVNGYGGSAAVAANDLDSAIFEVNPLATDHEVHKAIDTIFSRMLYPQCFKLSTATYTPNLATGEIVLNAADMKVISAHQVIGGVSYPIPVGIQRNLHSSVASSGVMGYFDFADSSTVYVTTERKLAIGDETTLDIVRLVSLGSAALLLGAAVSETDLERAKKDSQKRSPESAAQVLWRDFLTLKAQFAEEISRDTVTQFIVYRG